MHHPRRFWRTSVAVAILIVTLWTPHKAAAANCSAAPHKVALSGGTASPGSGSTSTKFRFAVTYSDTKGCAPSVITVVIGGTSYPLSQVGGSLNRGATFSVDLRLPAGSWSYQFYASSGAGTGQTVTMTAVAPSVVSVVLSAPTPTSLPTPKPTARPTPVPTTQPLPTSAVSSPSPRPTPVADVSGPAASGEVTNAKPPNSTVVWNDHGARGEFEAVALPSRPTPPPSPGAAGPLDSPSAQTTIDFSGVPRPLLALGIAGVGTVWGIGFFIVLSRRFLDPSGDRGRHQLEAFSAVPKVDAPTSGASGDLAPWSFPKVTAVPDAADSDSETIRTVAPSGALWGGTTSNVGVRFTEPPAPGTDRCRVISRLVPLRVEPDELCRIYAGRLDVGDDVDVLRREGRNCFVRTPSGLEGWLPGLTIASLGPANLEPAEPGADPTEQPRPAATQAPDGPRSRSRGRRS